MHQRAPGRARPPPLGAEARRGPQFLMPDGAIHTIEWRGTVVAGRVEQGIAVVGQKVEVLGPGGALVSVITSVEVFNRPLERSEAGENFGLLLRGVEADDVRRGRGS